MDILKILEQSLQKIQAQIKGSEAEDASSYHDLSHWRVSNLLWYKSRDVRDVIIALSFLGLPADQQNSFRERAHKIAEKYQNEGQWMEVKELLDLQTTAPGRILHWYLSTHSPEDWFGDTLRHIIRIIRSLHTYNPYLPTKGRVRRPQRKRGYDDKGHLSKSFKLGPELLARSDRERSEYTELNEPNFYPEWYQREKLEKQSHLMEDQLFPDDKENKER